LAAATGIKDKPRTLAHVKDFIWCRSDEWGWAGGNNFE
jgi:hypothetical protein